MINLITADQEEFTEAVQVCEEKKDFKIIFTELLSVNVSPSWFVFILFGNFPKEKIKKLIEPL